MPVSSSTLLPLLGNSIPRALFPAGREEKRPQTSKLQVIFIVSE